MTEIDWKMSFLRFLFLSSNKELLSFTLSICLEKFFTLARTPWRNGFWVNIENETCKYTWVELKLVFKPNPDPKSGPLGPQTVQKLPITAETPWKVWLLAQHRKLTLASLFFSNFAFWNPFGAFLGPIWLFLELGWGDW